MLPGLALLYTLAIDLFAIENKPKITHALIGFILLKITGQHHATQEKFFRKMEVRLFSKRNKTVSLVFLDNNKKCYDMLNT